MKSTFIAMLLMSVVSLADETRLTVRDATFHVTTAGDVRSLTAPDGSSLHEFAEREEISNSVASKAGSCLLLLVRVARPTKPGSSIRGAWDYGYLLRLTKSADNRWTVKKLMERDSASMTNPRRWVSELGAVADDGSAALLKVAVTDAPQAPNSVQYPWQTWDLQTPKMLSEGLSMDNAKKP